jgi:hypothetical protein
MTPFHSLICYKKGMPQRLCLGISLHLVYRANTPWKRIRHQLIVYFSLTKCLKKRNRVIIFLQDTVRKADSR